MLQYNKDELKNGLTIEQVFDFVADLGGEPQSIQNGMFISRTICHNPAGHGSYKLYYYDNTKLFKCYTECNETFDIFDLTRKQKTIISGSEWSLPQAMIFVAAYFGYTTKSFGFDDELTKEWELLRNYERINQQSSRQIVELKVFDESILRYLPRPLILDWEREGVDRQVIYDRGIAYNPQNEAIIIPHYDINGHLVGIRERTLAKDQEKNGKYRPAKLNNKMYNHPLAFNLYNINNSKEAIKKMRLAVVFEGKR